MTLVIALGTFRGDLVAGGAFTSIAGRGTRGLATYTNQVWRPVGRGLQAPLIGSSAPTASLNAVISDAQYDYYGGNFLGLASINSGYFARQSRTTGEWVPVASPDGAVFRLRQLDLDGAGPEPSRIFAGLGLAGGNFIPAGLRSFDGQTWRNELGAITLPASSTTAGIYCVEVFEGDLVAGGNFTQIDGASVRFIVRRVNGVWQQMGTRQIATTRDLLVHDGALYAAGTFGTGVNGVARWNGADWTTTGFPVASAWRLAIHNGRLIASSSTATDGSLATIYELRSGAWFRLGVTDFAEPLASLNGTLYAGYRRLSGQEFVASVLNSLTGPIPRDMTLNAQGDRVYVGLTTQRLFCTVPVADPRPRFTSPPQLVTACPESDVTMTVQVTLDSGSEIVWRRNGVPLPPQGAEGVTTDTLTLRRVTAADSGTYDVIGIGACGVTTSQPVTLNVNESVCVPVCGDIDFNNNDVFPEEEDIIAFFRVLAGGECTQ